MGDLGFCGQLCDTVADCLNKTQSYVCNMQTFGSFGHGYCQPVVPPPPDAGPDAPPDAKDAAQDSSDAPDTATDAPEGG